MCACNIKSLSATASLAASARISPQETIPGQKSSISALANSMTSNPPSEAFAGSSFSVSFPSISTDASQPCKNRCSLRQSSHEREAAVISLEQLRRLKLLTLLCF